MGNASHWFLLMLYFDSQAGECWQASSLTKDTRYFTHNFLAFAIPSDWESIGKGERKQSWLIWELILIWEDFLSASRLSGSSSLKLENNCCILHPAVDILRPNFNLFWKAEISFFPATIINLCRSLSIKQTSEMKSQLPNIKSTSCLAFKITSLIPQKAEKT